jgi:hypothetical protein
MPLPCSTTVAVLAIGGSTPSGCPNRSETVTCRGSGTLIQTARRRRAHFFMVLLALTLGAEEYATLAFLVPLAKNDTLTRTSLP